jgi:hypothetical protein
MTGDDASYRNRRLRTGLADHIASSWIRDVPSLSTGAAAQRRRARPDELHDPLSHLDELMPALFGHYQHQHTGESADKIASFDGFVMATAEYNHSISGGQSHHGREDHASSSHHQSISSRACLPLSKALGREGTRE